MKPKWNSALNFKPMPTEVVVADPHWVARACEIAAVCSSDEPLADNADVDYANDLLREAGDLRDAVDTRRKLVKDPFFQAGKRIDEEAKPLLTALDAAILQLRNKLLAYKQKRDAEAAALASTLEDGRTPALDLTAEIGSKIPVRKTKEARITDPKLVPDKFWCIDVEAVKAALLAGETVPGAELVLVETVVRR